MFLGPKEAALKFLAEIPTDDGMEWMAMMQAQCRLVFEGKVTCESWRNCNVVYLEGERDMFIPYILQLAYVSKVRMARDGNSLLELRCISSRTGHCPNITAPERVVTAIRCAAGEAIPLL